MTTALVLPAAALLAGLAPVRATPGGGKAAGPPVPVLVARGEGYLVHAVPNPAADQEVPGRAQAGLQLLHTSLPAGRMKVLVTTGTWTSFRTRRPRYGQSRLAGVAADPERLYVLTWYRSGWDFPPPDDPGGARKAGAAAQPGGYRLSVFWLADGSRVYDQPLGGSGVPAEAPKETAEKGHLRLTGGGVAWFGTLLSFKGREVMNAVIAGVVKEVDAGGILLDGGVRVGVNAQTKYFIETGRDPREAKLADIRPGKAVEVVAEQKGGKLVAASVMVSRLQPVNR